jgi:hypothetical protein
MKPKGQDPITSVILEATENQAYADQTDLGEATVLLQRLLGPGLPRDPATAPPVR